MQASIVQRNGYVWLALPREGVLPLMLLEQMPENVFKGAFGKDSANVVHSDVFGLFPVSEGAVIPKVSKPEGVSFIQGHDILHVNARFNVEGLKAIPNVVNANVSGKLKKASLLLFSFGEVRSLHVDEVVLEGYLNVSKMADAAGYVEKLREGRLYVVSEVLQTNEFSIEDASSFGMEGDISLGAIDDYLVKVGVGAGGERTHSNRLSYKGDKPITFALKAHKILYNKKKGKYSLAIAPIKVVRGEGEIETEDLDLGGGCLELG